MSEAIEFYDPSIPAAHWAQIEEFVRAAVAECDAKTPYAARRLMTPFARLTHWAWLVAALPLERDVICRREVIAEFIDKNCDGLAVASRGTYRARLNSMSDVLLSAPLRAHRPPPIGRGNVIAPYTPDEVTLLRHWALGQATQHRRVNAHILLALGLGAGLSSVETMAVQARHVLIDDLGAQIEVQGDRARVVPVLAEWEQPLVDLAGSAMRPDMWLFSPGRQSASPKNLISHFIARSNDTPVHVHSQRLRSTWLVGHLTAGTPTPALMRAAGLESLEPLSRYLPFVPEIDSLQARRLLRRNLDPFRERGAE